MTEQSRKWTLRLAVAAAFLACAFTVAPQAGLAAEPPEVPDWTGRDPAAEKAQGAQLYAENCAACHDAGVLRAPQRRSLQDMSPDSIRRALTDGLMREQGAALSVEDRVAVAEYITGRSIGLSAQASPASMCQGRSMRFDMRETPVFAGWGLDANSSHAIPAATSGLRRSTVGRLRLKWAFGVPGAVRMRSQPALAGGAIVFGSHTGAVYALDRESGCIRWIFNADAEVRTGIVIAPWRRGAKAANPLVYFGDAGGNAYGVELLTGRQVWKISADDHPAATITAAPTLHGATLYLPVSSSEEAYAASPGYACCTFRGSVVALDAATGAVRWRSYMIGEPASRGTGADGTERFGPAGAAVWNTPVVDAARGQLYFATSDNYTLPATGMSDAIVALDLATGRVKWHYQTIAGDAWNVDCVTRTAGNCPAVEGPDFGFGAGTVLTRGSNGREVVIAGQKSGWAFAIDPDSGRLVWKQRVGSGGVSAGIYFGMAAERGRIFIPVTDRPDNKTYDYPASPGVHALDIATGAFVWRAAAQDVCAGRPLCIPGHGGAITTTAGMVLAGSDDGHMRIFDAGSGAVLSDIDTARDFQTVNGAAARGGAISGGAAPLAYKGQLIVASGYGFASKMPGNVLLVYGVD